VGSNPPARGWRKGRGSRLEIFLPRRSSIAVQGDWVYVAESDAGRILRVATDGSANPAVPLEGPCPAPLGTPEEVALTPRADQNLERLALSLDPGNVTAGQATYDRVVRDVAAIRALISVGEAIGYGVRDDGRTLFLGLSPIAATSITARKYAAWDCLNERYGANTTEPHETGDGGWSTTITLRGIYNLERLAERYAALPGVTSAVPLAPPGEGRALCAARHGHSIGYVVALSEGECLTDADCVDTQVFESDAGGRITSLGPWSSESGEPTPPSFGQCPRPGSP
jgi:hypothetical protein